MELNILIKKTYEIFYRKFTENKSFVYESNDSDNISIENFIAFLEKKYTKASIGTNFIHSFFVYQFSFYSKPGFLKSKRYLRLSTVLGAKSRERWENKTDSELKTILLKENFLSISEKQISDLLLDNSYRTEMIKKIFKLEEIERQRFFNSEFGFLNCIELTMGYSEKSVYCGNKCKFLERCKVISKK